MRKLVLIICTTFLIASCSKEKTLHYTVTKTLYDSIPVLNIAMKFDAENDGETTLLFQDHAWGETDIHNVLADLESLNEGVEVMKIKDSGQIILKHPKDLETIHFQYKIVQDTKLPITTKKAFRPIVQDEYFHAFSHNLFMLPSNYASSSDSKFNVHIHWKGFDSTFNLINSFGTNDQHQVIKNTDKNHFHSAVFTGGDYRAHEIIINGNDAVLGIRGDWKVFNDSTIVDVLESTLQAQRDFWQDHSQEYFAVTMTPTFLERGTGFQGSGLTNSFATTATNNTYLNLEGLVYLFNHELQHNWTGHIIVNENEEEQYWFSEGFTEYYTLKNIARNRIANLDESYFINELNKRIKALYISPVKEAPNSEINYNNFWTSRDYEKLPYRRGTIFAFYLDNKIRKASNGAKSLDDLMLAIKEDAVSNKQKLSHPYFLSKANEYLTEDLSLFFNKHIVQGKLFDLIGMFNEFDCEFNPTSVVFDLGLTLSEDKKSIARVDENSNAYKAGLRKGDRLTLRSFYYGNPEFKAEFKVYKNGKETHHTYFPSKEAKIPSLKDNDHNKKAVY
ncbi:M1 family aminopeptidase [Flavobacteriaceae bacterium S356]|uniref:M1 family aminopeptidase n=1 Tax=Asprobacillus argus TaxID=3076534 RepID=A0ABU3LIK4_9FLAO|nr:M1 family aminopeptidase [Flavobacteriaceae bacterium S356]